MVRQRDEGGREVREGSDRGRGGKEEREREGGEGWEGKGGRGRKEGKLTQADS